MWRNEVSRAQLGLGICLVAAAVYLTDRRDSSVRSSSLWVLTSAGMACASGGGFQLRVVRHVLRKPLVIMSLLWLAALSITDVAGFYDEAVNTTALRPDSMTVGEYMSAKVILQVIVVEGFVWALILPAGRMEFPNQAFIHGTMTALYMIAFLVGHIHVFFGESYNLPTRVVVQFSPNSAMTVDSLRRDATLFITIFMSKMTLANLSSSIRGTLALCCARTHSLKLNAWSASSTRSETATAARRRRKDNLIASLRRVRRDDFKCHQLAVAVPRWNALDDYALELSRSLRKELGSREDEWWSDAVAAELDRHAADVNVFEKTSAHWTGRRRQRAFAGPSSA